MNTLTVAQLKKACQENKYLLLRYYKNNSLIGINCKAAKIALKGKIIPDDRPTKYISYQPCNFITYLHYKTPFL